MKRKSGDVWNRNLDYNLGYLINRTALRMFLGLQRAMRESGYDVTVHQWGILQMLYEQDGLSQVEIAERTRKDKPNVTRILDIMEKNQLISRRPDENDRRKFLIYLTSEGRKLKDKLAPIAAAVRKQAFRGVKKNDLEHLRDTINRIYSNLEETEY